ncbi:MAG: acyltransferase, partial [Clostridiales bacterium]|nr:acyltransferase [Clostridiales bacterium]
MLYGGGITERKEKKICISLMELVLCLLVIYIHAASDAVTNYSKSSIFTLALFSGQKIAFFAMSGFLFTSALKLAMGNSTERQPYQKYMLARIKRAIPGYLFWVLAFYLYFVYVLKYFPFSWGKLAGYLLKGNLVSHFYFVPIILQFYLLAPAIVRFARKYPWKVGMALSVVLNLAFSW